MHWREEWSADINTKILWQWIDDRNTWWRLPIVVSSICIRACLEFACTLEWIDSRFSRTIIDRHWLFVFVTRNYVMIWWKKNHRSFLLRTFQVISQVLFLKGSNIIKKNPRLRCKVIPPFNHAWCLVLSHTLNSRSFEDFFQIPVSSFIRFISQIVKTISWLLNHHARLNKRDSNMFQSSVQYSPTNLFCFKMI